MNKTLPPFFRPLFPAIHRHCQLCNADVTEEAYDSHAIQGHADRIAILCPRCEPIAVEVAEMVASESARLDQDYARSRDAELAEYTNILLAQRGIKIEGYEQIKSSPTRIGHK